jgi:hypothetical protein
MLRAAFSALHHEYSTAAALGTGTLLDHFPISRYNRPMTRRIGFVSFRPKTVLTIRNTQTIGGVAA